MKARQLAAKRILRDHNPLNTGPACEIPSVRLRMTSQLSLTLTLKLTGGQSERRGVVDFLFWGAWARG